MSKVMGGEYYDDIDAEPANWHRVLIPAVILVVALLTNPLWQESAAKYLAALHPVKHFAEHSHIDIPTETARGLWQICGPSACTGDRCAEPSAIGFYLTDGHGQPVGEVRTTCAALKELMK